MNNWPVARSGHTITQANNMTYMFGGFISKYGKVFLNLPQPPINSRDTHFLLDGHPQLDIDLRLHNLQHFIWLR